MEKEFLVGLTVAEEKGYIVVGKFHSEFHLVGVISHSKEAAVNRLKGNNITGMYAYPLTTIKRLYNGEDKTQVMNWRHWNTFQTLLDNYTYEELEAKVYEFDKK